MQTKNDTSKPEDLPEPVTGEGCQDRLVLRCDACQHQRWSSATMDDPYPHVWCGKGHWEGAEPSGITEDPWKDCADFFPQNIKVSGTHPTDGNNQQEDVAG